MSCDVCLWGPDDVDNVFSAEKTVTARKRHRCCECSAEIAPGVQYERSSGKSAEDGGLFVYKTCLLCAEIRRVFYCNGTGWYFTMLWEDMEEQAFPHLTTASPCFLELSPAAKAFVLEKWAEWKRTPTARR